MNISEIDKIAEEFALFDDWEEKYSYIIDLGKKMPKLDDQFKQDENLVKGCVSRVWLVYDIDQEGKIIRFNADSDAFIVKGLIALLHKIYSGKSPQEIISINIEDFFHKIGLDKYLTPNRANGFFAMVADIKAKAGKLL